jgi:hypothetical protein
VRAARSREIKEGGFMDRLFAYALAIAVLLGTSALLGNSSRVASTEESREARLATDGAFRDGIFVGRLSAQWGQPPRPAVGRWSSERDRASFVAGYQRGYEEFIVKTR